MEQKNPCGANLLHMIFFLHMTSNPSPHCWYSLLTNYYFSRSIWTLFHMKIIVEQKLQCGTKLLHIVLYFLLTMYYFSCSIWKLSCEAKLKNWCFTNSRIFCCPDAFNQQPLHSNNAIQLTINISCKISNIWIFMYLRFKCLNIWTKTSHYHVKSKFRLYLIIPLRLTSSKKCVKYSD